MERSFRFPSEKKGNSSVPLSKISKPFLFLFLWVHVAISQNYTSRNYTASNELPNNSVRSLLIDSNDILWIGTENGVVKKENDEFEYFFEEDGLALNSCWDIAQDLNNNLWFGSYGQGVSSYNGSDFEVISEKEGLVHNQVTKLFSYGDHIYVGTSNGVSIIDIHTLKVLASHTVPGVELFRVQDFFQYQQQVYVVTYNSGIFKIQTQNGASALVRMNNHRLIYAAIVHNDSIYSSNKGYFTKSSVADYVNQQDSITTAKLGTSIIWDYTKTQDDRIFAAAWGIYESSGGLYELIDDHLISRAIEFNIPSRDVISLAYDPHFEKLYAGTRDAGLFEISLNSQVKFKRFPENSVLGFASTDSTSAVLLKDAIVLKQGNTEQTIDLNKLKSWKTNYIASTTQPLPKHRDGFYELDYATKAADIRFYDIKAKEDTYWLNTSVGIFAIKDSGELERYVPLHTEVINFTTTGNLIETNPYGGLRLYDDLDNFSYTHFKKEDPDTPTMIVSSLRWGNKTYFLSIFSGLYVWEGNNFTSYMADGIWQEKKLKHITPLGDHLAISNEFGDVFIVNDDKAFSIVKKIPRASFQGNSISFLTQYQGTLIIGTEKGVTLYKNDRIILLDHEQGLKQPLHSAKIRQDRLYIGSNQGFYIIDPAAITASTPLVDKLKIKDVLINNSTRSLGALSQDKRLSLAHNENNLLLRFGTNAHPYPNKLRYQYRLTTNSDWSLPSSNPEIFLPFLPAEQYQIAVRVLDQSTGLSYTQPLLQLEVHPPFWKTWWFILLIISLLLLGVYANYSYQIQQHRNFEKQKRKIQKRFEETKMEALLAQMNPHFIFNAMNSIQYYIANNDVDNASIFLGEFAKLIRLNLDYCTRPTLLLVEEIEYLESYTRVENTRFNNTIQVSIQTDPKIDPYELEIPTMLLQTFVENVFVHAFPMRVSNPELIISFNLLSRGIVQCQIKDNGVGYTACSSNLHQSKGIRLVKERLSLMDYNVDKAIQIESKKNKGTTVTLFLEI